MPQDIAPNPAVRLKEAHCEEFKITGKVGFFHLQDVRLNIYDKAEGNQL